MKRPASGRTETGDVDSRSETECSRRPLRECPQSGLVSRRTSESRAPSANRVHRERNEHHSLGRVSKESAKKGRISDLLHDTVLVRCETGGRSVEYALEVSPSIDRRQAVINAALDEQALDLDGNLDRDDVNVSVDEASL